VKAFRICSPSSSFFRHQSGGVTVEAALVFGFLVTVFMLFFDLARLFQNLIHLPLLTYNASVPLGKYAPEIAPEISEARVARLFADLTRNLEDAPVVTTSTDENGTVTMTIDAALKSNFQAIWGSLNLQMQVTAPQLAAATNNVPESAGPDPCGCEVGDGECSGSSGSECDTYESPAVTLPDSPPGSYGYDPQPTATPNPTATPDGGGGCFSGDTLITMADGSQRPIATIKRGDRVLSYDTRRKRQMSGRVRYAFKIRVAGDYYLLNGSIKVTGEHPFFADGRWVKVKDLKIGDSLMLVSGEKAVLFSMERVFEALPVYNMSVARYRDYYAAGILVHNKDSEDLPFDMGGSGDDP